MRNAFIFTFFHASSVKFILHHCFDVLGSDPVAVWWFAFFEFVDCSTQLFCRDLWDSRHFIGVVVTLISAAFIFILSDFLFRFFTLIVVVPFVVELSKDIGNPFSRCADFSFFFCILVMRILFFADLIPVLFFTPLNSSSILWMSCWDVLLSFHCFVSDTFLMNLLTYFSRWFLLFGCTSPFLDESSDFRVFSWNLLSLFCCCRLTFFFTVFTVFTIFFYLRSCCCWHVTR